MPFLFPIPLGALRKALKDEPDERQRLLLAQRWLASPTAHGILLEKGEPTRIGLEALRTLLEVLGAKHYSAKRKLVLRPHTVYLRPGAQHEVRYSSPRAPTMAEATIPGLPEELLAKAEQCTTNPRQVCIIITSLNPLEL